MINYKELKIQKYKAHSWLKRMILLDDTCCFISQVLQTQGGQGYGVNLDVCLGKEDPTTFFNDGIRKIDFVLVVEENVKNCAESDGIGDGFNNSDNIDTSSK